MSAIRLQAAYRLLFALALATAMLGTQWIGYAHGVAHSDLTSQHAVDSGEHSLADLSGKHSEEHRDIAHSCFSFDAAALADVLDCASFSLPLITKLKVSPAWTAFASWDEPFKLHFSSRAPPLRLASA